LGALLGWYDVGEEAVDTLLKGFAAVSIAIIVRIAAAELLHSGVAVHGNHDNR